MSLLDNPNFQRLLEERESFVADEQEARMELRFFNMGLLKDYGDLMQPEERERLEANLDTWGDVTDTYFQNWLDDKNQWRDEKLALETRHEWLKELWPNIDINPQEADAIDENYFSPTVDTEGFTFTEAELPPELQEALATHRENPFEMTRLDLVRTVNEYANDRFEYKTDMEQYGVLNTMMSPREVLSTTKDGKFYDDCDGLASVKAGYLVAMGFTDDEVTIVSAYNNVKEVGHAVVAVNLLTGPVLMNYDLEEPGDNYYSADEPTVVFSPNLSDIASTRNR